MYDSADATDIDNAYPFAVIPTLVEQFTTKTALLHLPAILLTSTRTFAATERKHQRDRAINTSEP
jgi:hypothetical protein